MLHRPVRRCDNGRTTERWLRARTTVLRVCNPQLVASLARHARSYRPCLAVSCPLLGRRGRELCICSRDFTILGWTLQVPTGNERCTILRYKRHWTRLTTINRRNRDKMLIERSRMVELHSIWPVKTTKLMQYNCSYVTKPVLS